MPQPLRRWDRTISWAPADLSKRPDLAIYIAKIATLWARIELDQAILLIALLGSHAPSGVQMYLALTGAGAQEAALTAAASGLSAPLKDRFQSLMIETKKRSRERNRVVHALWGIGEQFPDALIHCPIENQATDIIGELQIASVISKLGLQVIPGDASKEFTRNCSVYTAADFKNIYNRIASLQRTLTDFREAVSKERLESERLARELNQKQLDRAASRRDPQTTPSKPD